MISFFLGVLIFSLSFYKNNNQVIYTYLLLLACSVIIIEPCTFTDYLLFYQLICISGHLPIFIVFKVIRVQLKEFRYDSGSIIEFIIIDIS